MVSVLRHGAIEGESLFERLGLVHECPGREREELRVVRGIRPRRVGAGQDPSESLLCLR